MRAIFAEEGIINQTRMVRSVAVFEAAKGLIVLLAGAGSLTFLHRDLSAVAESWIAELHMNPAHHYPRVFLDLANNLQNGGLWLLAGAALVYALVRGVEAYALWHERPWAEWFAALSGAIYIPIELRELYRSANPIAVAALVANILIVAFMVQCIRSARAQRKALARSRKPAVG